MMMKNTPDPLLRRLVLTIATLSLAGPLSSQSQPTDTVPAYLLDEVTVTATRAVAPRSAVPQRIDVVTSDDIARTAPVNVAELLRRNTPVEMIEYPGLLTGIAMRGFRPDYAGATPRTLILIDGRPAGTNNLTLLSLGGVERVEVLRGPASALYGSSAMSGVINVISRASRGPLEGYAGAGYGSFGAYQAGGRVGGALTSRLDFDLNVASVGQSAGYRTGRNRILGGDILRVPIGDTASPVPWTTVDTIVSFTEYASRSGGGRVSYSLSNAWRVDAGFEGFVAENVQNPGDLTPGVWPSRSLKDLSRHSVELGVTGTAGRSTRSARFFSARERIDYFSSPEPPHFVGFRTPLHTYGVQLQNALERGAVSLVTGMDFSATEVASQRFLEAGVRGAPFNPDAGIHSTAAFTQARFRLLDGRTVVSAGGRADRVTFTVHDTPGLSNHSPNSESHTVLTPNAGVRYTLPAGLQLYGNAGGAFVTPEAFQVAGYAERRPASGRSVHVTMGNASLRPETGRSWDAGLASIGSVTGLEADFTYYRTDVANRIGPDRRTPDGATFTVAGDTILSITSFLNVDRARIRGIEGRISYDLATLGGFDRSIRLFLDGNRVLRAEEFLADGAKPRRIKNVADLTLLGGLDFDDLRRLRGRLAARYVGERTDLSYEDYVSEMIYPHYLVFDVTSSLRVSKGYRVGAEIRNLADEDYFEVRGYSLPGRSLRLSLDVAF